MQKLSQKINNKIILFGEHFVVYDAPCICSICSDIFCESIYKKIKKSENTKINLESDIGKCSISLSDLPFFSGKKQFKPYFFLLSKMYELNLIKKNFEYDIFLSTNAFKGLGRSSCFAASISKLISKKKLTKKEIFLLCQEMDLNAHGKKASGVDAMASSIQKSFIFKKDKGFRKINFINLPKQLDFLVIDTLKNSKKRSNTLKLIEVFKKNKKIKDNLSLKEKNQLNKDYLKIFKKAIIGFKSKKYNLIFDAMNENHFLLKEAGVSSKNIENSIQILNDNGALGSKLTGAGGNGGAVISICKNKDTNKIIKNLENQKFKVYKTKLI